METLPIHTRFEPQRGQDAERKGRATPSQARFWSVSRVGRLLLSWTSLGGFEKPQQARGWWSSALEIRQGKSQFQVKREVPLVGPPVGCGSGRFPDPHGASGGHVLLIPSSSGCTADLHVTQIPRLFPHPSIKPGRSGRGFGPRSASFLRGDPRLSPWFIGAGSGLPVRTNLLLPFILGGRDQPSSNYYVQQFIASSKLALSKFFNNNQVVRAWVPSQGGTLPCATLSRLSTTVALQLKVVNVCHRVIDHGPHLFFQVVVNLPICP